MKTERHFTRSLVLCVAVGAATLSPTSKAYAAGALTPVPMPSPSVRVSQPPSTAPPVIAPPVAAVVSGNAPVTFALPIPKVLFQLVTPDGQVTDRTDFEYSVSWSRREDDPGVRRPELKIRIRLPKEFDLKSLDPDLRAKVEGSAGSRIVILGTDTLFTRMPLARTYKDPAHPKAPPVTDEVTLVVSAAIEKPIYWVERSCSEAGIVAKMIRDKGNFLYAAVACDLSADSIDVYLLHSSDAGVMKSTSIGEKEKTGIGWTQYRFKRPRPSSAVSHVFGRFGIAELKKPTDFSVYELDFTPEAERKLTMSASLGASSISYKETPGSIHLTEIGLTGKFSARYPVYKRSFYVNGSVYGTLLPLTHSPATVPAARFYGINGRVGYRLPIEMGANEWSFLAGWYLWGMVVSPSSYGVKTLAGPQFFINYSNLQAGHRSWDAYVKWAPVSKSIAFGTSNNRELAFGFAYELTSPLAYRQWKAIFDYQDVRASAQGVGQITTFMAQIITLGVQTSL